MGDAESVGLLEKKYSRRSFIKGVIAVGATASSTGYLLGGAQALGAQMPGATERLITLNINGQDRRVDVLPHETLAMTLRYRLNMTGTKFGCDRAECGACTVLIGKRPVRSCGITVGEVAGKEITTIEGLSADSSHPVQMAWVEEQVPQCGYCQSGQILAAVSLLERKPNPTDNDIDRGMLNLCRCGTYPRIKKAIHRASELLKEVA